MIKILIFEFCLKRNFLRDLDVLLIFFYKEAIISQILNPDRLWGLWRRLAFANRATARLTPGVSLFATQLPNRKSYSIQVCKVYKGQGPREDPSCLGFRVEVVIFGKGRYSKSIHSFSRFPFLVCLENPKNLWCINYLQNKINKVLNQLLLSNQG